MRNKKPPFEITKSMFGVSSATANRILAGLANEGKVQKVRIGSSWGYVTK